MHVLRKHKQALSEGRLWDGAPCSADELGSEVGGLFLSRTGYGYTGMYVYVRYVSESTIVSSRRLTARTFRERPIKLNPVK